MCLKLYTIRKELVEKLDSKILIPKNLPFSLHIPFCLVEFHKIIAIGVIWLLLALLENVTSFIKITKCFIHLINHFH